LSQGLVDELQYNETGNEVQLVKYFPAVGNSKNNGQKMVPGVDQ
jgi:hypothetical protein